MSVFDKILGIANIVLSFINLLVVHTVWISRHEIAWWSLIAWFISGLAAALVLQSKPKVDEEDEPFY